MGFRFLMAMAFFVTACDGRDGATDAGTDAGGLSTAEKCAAYLTAAEAGGCGFGSEISGPSLCAAYIAVSTNSGCLGELDADFACYLAAPDVCVASECAAATDCVSSSSGDSCVAWCTQCLTVGSGCTNECLLRNAVAREQNCLTEYESYANCLRESTMGALCEDGPTSCSGEFGTLQTCLTAWCTGGSSRILCSNP